MFTRIHLRYTVAGRGLDPRQVERAVALSKEKYCSATIMLAKTAEVTYEIVVVDDVARAVLTRTGGAGDRARLPVSANPRPGSGCTGPARDDPPPRRDGAC